MADAEVKFYDLSSPAINTECLMSFPLCDSQWDQFEKPYFLRPILVFFLITSRQTFIAVITM